MRKLTLLALGAAFLALPGTAAYAQDTLIIDDGYDSVLEGIVKTVRYSDLVIDVGGKEIKVEIDDLNIDNKADEYFPVGTKVQVIGKIIDDDEMDARKVVRLDVAPEPEIPPLQQ